MRVLIFLFLPISAFSQFSNRLEIPPIQSGTNFELIIEDSSKQFLDGNRTETIGFNGAYLGPTLIFEKGDFVKITVDNQLNEPTTVHWHGMHVAPEDDGGPHTVIEAGRIWNPDFQILDRASTFWYHPHLHEKTNEHVVLGAAGMIIVKSDDEEELDLPRTYGVNDIPLIVQGKNMDSENQFVIDGGPQPFDNVIMVNGTLYPFIEVSGEQIRLRLLNASNETVMNFGFDDNRNFNQIGSDGGLLRSPVLLSRLRLSPGERAELVVDFTNDTNSEVKMVTYASEFGPNIPGGSGQGSSGIEGLDTEILEFRIGQSDDEISSALPDVLSIHTPWEESDANRTRTVVMNPFIFDEMVFDLNFINQNVQLNDIEIWNLTNISSVSHVFHIHDVQFYILDRNGNSPAESEKGLKDVVLVEGGETVRFITKFEDFSDSEIPYMYHCHILPHEDQGMMGQFLVLDSVNEKGEAPLSSNSIISKVRVYPNPVTDKIVRVLLPDNVLPDAEVSFTVHDMAGAEVAYFPSSICGPSNLKILYLERYKSGTYNISTMVNGELLSSVRMVLK